jgi:hypothetical protein
MALTAYTRFRFLWGALESESGDETPTFDASNTHAGIPSANAARRVNVVWSRLPLTEDRVQTHFDIVNVTGGQLDPTWTSTDYDAVETALSSLHSSIAAHMPTAWVLDQFRWYRIGPGAIPPEPAVRITEKNTPGGGGTSYCPLQLAFSVTLKTGAKGHWGRNYLPLNILGAISSSTGMWASGTVAAVSSAYSTFINSLAAADFYLVVYSKAKPARVTKSGRSLPAADARLYTVEGVQVDNVPDVIRRRRARTNITRTTVP